MAKERYLRHAPITEALIDIRVKLPAEKQDMVLLKTLSSMLEKEYPGQFPPPKDLQDIQMRFEPGPPPIQETKNTPVGFRYDSKDRKKVIQTRVDGFTFSWLKPYENWETVRGHAHSIWQLYRDLMRPESITRVATRFINQIDIPGPAIDFDDYLTAAPVIPKGLPQAYSDFLTRIVLPDVKNDLTVIVTQVFQPGINPSVVPVVLDIDVFQSKLIENIGGSWDKIAWETIDGLRAVKNRVFFESITEKTAELLA